MYATTYIRIHLLIDGKLLMCGHIITGLNCMKPYSSTGLGIANNLIHYNETVVK